MERQRSPARRGDHTSNSATDPSQPKSTPKSNPIPSKSDQSRSYNLNLHTSKPPSSNVLSSEVRIDQRGDSFAGDAQLQIRQKNSLDPHNCHQIQSAQVRLSAPESNRSKILLPNSAEQTQNQRAPEENVRRTPDLKSAQLSTAAGHWEWVQHPQTSSPPRLQDAVANSETGPRATASTSHAEASAWGSRSFADVVRAGNATGPGSLSGTMGVAQSPTLPPACPRTKVQFSNLQSVTSFWADSPPCFVGCWDHIAQPIISASELQPTSILKGVHNINPRPGTLQPNRVAVRQSICPLQQRMVEKADHFLATPVSTTQQPWQWVRRPCWWRRERQASFNSQLPTLQFRIQKFKEKTRGRCFNCLASDHKRASCRNPTRGWKCMRYGHISSRCKSKVFVGNLYPAVNCSRNNEAYARPSPLPRKAFTSSPHHQPQHFHPPTCFYGDGRDLGRKPREDDEKDLTRRRIMTCDPLDTRYRRIDGRNTWPDGDMEDDEIQHFARYCQSDRSLPRHPKDDGIDDREQRRSHTRDVVPRMPRWLDSRTRGKAPELDYGSSWYRGESSHSRVRDRSRSSPPSHFSIPRYERKALSLLRKDKGGCADRKYVRDRSYSPPLSRFNMPRDERKALNRLRKVKIESGKGKSASNTIGSPSLEALYGQIDCGYGWTEQQPLQETRSASDAIHIVPVDHSPITQQLEAWLGSLYNSKKPNPVAQTVSSPEISIQTEVSFDTASNHIEQPQENKEDLTILAAATQHTTSNQAPQQQVHNIATPTKVQLDTTLVMSQPETDPHDAQKLEDNLTLSSLESYTEPEPVLESMTLGELNEVVPIAQKVSLEPHAERDSENNFDNLLKKFKEAVTKPLEPCLLPTPISKEIIQVEIKAEQRRKKQKNRSVLLKSKIKCQKPVLKFAQEYMASSITKKHKKKLPSMASNIAKKSKKSNKVAEDMAT